MEIWTPLSTSLISICTLPVVLTSILAYFIPETKNTNLPLSMRDADKLNEMNEKSKATRYPIDGNEKELKSRECSSLQNTVDYPLNELIPIYALHNGEFNELKVYNMV